MTVKTIIDEDFTNYKLPSMLIGTAFCNWKCCKEANLPVTTCQNHPIAAQKNIDIPTDEILRRYTQNPITQAVVIAGLEPFLQYQEIFDLINAFRSEGIEDPIVLYTGYNKEEISAEISMLSMFKNIIVKFGRFIPGHTAHFDEILGVNLASNNQYAEVISW